MKKGVAFILDAVLALTVAVIVFTALWGTHHARVGSAGRLSFRNLHYLSGDILEVLNKKGVLDEVGENWVNASGNKSSSSWINASESARYYLERLIPPHIGYRLTIDGDTLVENTSRKLENESISQTHSSRMLVGYGRDLPTRGAAARAFITGIAGKDNAVYAYFGGFIGEGEITKKIVLPDTLESISRAYIELNAGHPFDLIVNGVDSGCCSTSGSAQMRANVKEYIANPDSLFNAGENTIQLVFTGANLDSQYVGGGFIRVEYNTTDYETPEISGWRTHDIPGVVGVVNVYDGLDVPGQLYSMNAFLHYNSNYTVYLALGDTILFSSNASGVEENVTLTNGQLDALLDYNSMSGKTTPLRVGTSNITILSEESKADVVLTTDVSFSMWNDRCMDGNWRTIYDRDDPTLNDTATAKEVCTSECVRNDGELCHYPDYWSGYPECGDCGYGCWRSSGCGVNDGGSCTLPCYSCVWYGGEGAPQPENQYGGSYCYDCTNLGCQYCFNQDEDDLWCGVSCGPDAYSYYGVNGTVGDPLEPAPPGYCSLYICASGSRGSCSFDRHVTCDQSYVDAHTSYETDGLPSISHLTCPNRCFACNLTGIGLAQQLDLDFIGIILNYSGNQVGLVGYGDSTYDTHTLSNSTTSLNAQIGSYVAGGETCVCCAIDDAVDLLSDSNSSRNKYVVAMTDGVTNVRCNNALADLDGDSQITAKDDAIQSACTAKEEHNITVYAVGFGDAAGADTLQRIADCGGGYYYASNDTEGLSAIYTDIATEIINASYSSQVINITGSLDESILYPDSFIQVQYTGDAGDEYGQISVTLESNLSLNETTCSDRLFIGGDVSVVDFTVTSYSSEHWTDLVAAGSGGPTTAYTLRDGGFGQDYTILGDPFQVMVSGSYFTVGANNTIVVETGDSPETQTGCSGDDKAVYTLSFDTLADYGDVFRKSNGCNWSIMFSDNTIINKQVPDGVTHTKSCSYNNTNITYDLDDSLDDAVYRLLRKLDVDDDGRVDVSLNEDDISFEGTYTGSVRSLWGPLKVKLILWM